MEFQPTRLPEVVWLPPATSEGNLRATGSDAATQRRSYGCSN